MLTTPFVVWFCFSDVAVPFTFDWVGANPELRTNDTQVCLGAICIVESGGRTMLHYGAMSGSEETCRLLLDFGAETFVFDNEGNTPFIYAQRTGVHLKDFVKFEFSILLRQQEVDANALGAIFW